MPHQPDFQERLLEKLGRDAKPDCYAVRLLLCEAL
jgi:hypothetical protein